MLLKPDTVLSEVLAEHHELIPIIHRFGIMLGVGDKTIRELCKEYQLDINFILTVLNVCLDEDYTPENSQMTFSAEFIADYFKHTLESYAQELVPNIEKHLNAFIVLSGSEDKELAMLRKPFADFKEELLKYSQGVIKQDDALPYIQLNYLRNKLIRDASHSSNRNLCYAVIFSLHRLENDLIVHNRLREKILEPKLSRLNSADISELQHIMEEDIPPRTHSSDALTKREIDVLKLISAGFTNKAIADKLSISINTVLSHRKKIVAKTGIKTVSGLTFYCISQGLISPVNGEI